MISIYGKFNPNLFVLQKGSLENEIAELKSQAASYREQVCALQSQVTSLSNQNTVLSQHNATLQGENARLQVENTTLQSQSASLIAQNSALQTSATQSEGERDKVGCWYLSSLQFITVEMLFEFHEKLSFLFYCTPGICNFFLFHLGSSDLWWTRQPPKPVGGRSWGSSATPSTADQRIRQPCQGTQQSQNNSQESEARTKGTQGL